MTDRPTSTKPRAAQGVASPYIARTSNSGGSEPESELTAKAREVLAGLTKTQRYAMTDVRERDDGTLYNAADHEYRSDTWARLRRRGLLTRGEPGQAGAGTIFTDLGREVARLLSEVQHPGWCSCGYALGHSGPCGGMF